MGSGWDLVLIGVSVVLFAAVSRRLAGSPVTSAMVFVGIGILVGGDGLDLIETEVGSEELRLLAEVTLALVLFSDASSLDANRLRRQTSVPLRLLAIALPLTIVVGTLVALPLFAELALFEAVILAVLLAPTDAALGQTVVSDARLPTMVRQGLSVESGLNDGVCVPILVSAVALAELEDRPGIQGHLVRDLVREVTVALVVGAVVAAAVAWIVRQSEARGWMSGSWGKLVPLATIVIAYPMTAELHGSGFIASFVAGLVYGRLLGARARESVSLDEDLGQLLSAVTFLLFGAVMVGRAMDALDLATVAYAVLSLTLIRMVPVALSFVGSGATSPTMLFTGWFGPRGLATIVFTLTIVDESGLPGTDRITDVATITVLLSVVLHGLSAPWLTDRYVAWLRDHPDRLTSSGEQPVAVTCGSESPPSQ